MPVQVLEVGDKLHIITRRRFESDLRRHFVGTVTGISGGAQEVQGYVFVFNSGRNDFRRRPEIRTRILALGQADYIVNKIPREVAIESLEYRFIEKRLVCTDGQKFTLDINEFGHST